MSQSQWNPTDGNDWNNPANWDPDNVPLQTAVFALAPHTEVSFSSQPGSTVAQIEFCDNASPFNFTFNSSSTPWLTISDEVLNHSQHQQSFTVAATSSGFNAPQLMFTDQACAGNQNVFYCAGPLTKEGYGGGVIRFEGQSNAGNAFYKAWTGAGIPPKEGSTVGGEISFGEYSSAANASFEIYGSLGTDGDTFGNVVFHDNATAAQARFTNVGGTVSSGDGGNTQFYESTTAANGIFNNLGGTYPKANGGDVAFDGVSTGGNGRFFNHAATAENAYGGVTSFNNNWPDMPAGQGASAGNGEYANYGARGGELGGGGHLEFSARYGSPTADQAHIHNYGSSIEDKSSAGHTIFSINLPSQYFPTAGAAMIYNHPALQANGAAGFTEFSIYSASTSPASPSVSQVPTAGTATIINLGGSGLNIAGGYTVFAATSSAGAATLIAYGGDQGGGSGKIVFYDQADGADATVKLYNGGKLDVRDHLDGLTIGQLESENGMISIHLADTPPEQASISITKELILTSTTLYFNLFASDQTGLITDTAYPLLTCDSLLALPLAKFSANSINGIKPSFSIEQSTLYVSFPSL